MGLEKYTIIIYEIIIYYSNVKVLVFAFRKQLKKFNIRYPLLLISDGSSLIYFATVANYVFLFKLNPF